MARYVYNKEAVNGTIDQLEAAIGKINDVNSIIQEGFSIIQTARGGNYINISPAAALKYKDVAEQAIRGIIADIRSKAQIIDEYNSASWFTKAQSSVNMAFTKFVEGFFTAGENIIDGFASLGGLVVGIFSEDAQNAIGEFIAKDYVGDLFESAYNGGILSDVEKYSAFSSESSAANVFKGFGVATGYVAAIAVTGAPVSSLGANMAVAGIGGIGSGTQDALQAGYTYEQAALYGTKKGAVQAGTVLVFSKGTELLGKGMQRLLSKAGSASMALPAGTASAALPAGAGSLATTSITSTAGLSVGHSGIPSVLSIAPQQMGDTLADTQANINNDLLGLGGIEAPTVESTYTPSSIPPVETPSQSTTPSVQPAVSPVQPNDMPTAQSTTTTSTQTTSSVGNSNTSTGNLGATTGNSGTSTGNWGTSASNSGTWTSSPSTPISNSDDPIIDVPINEPVQPVETPIQPINTPETPANEPTQPNDTSTVTIPKNSPSINNPDAPIYKHQITTKNGNTKSSNGTAKGVASAIIGLGVVGTAGAVGYSVYNKKAREKEDEEEE